MTSRAGSTINWTSANQPATINGGGYTAAFDYAPDRSRWRQVASYAAGTETTIYVGGLMEKRTNATQTDYRHLIPTPSGFVQHVRRSTGSSTYYMAADHLGSVDAVLLGGSVLVRPSFAALGVRRDDDWNGLPSAAEQQQFANHTRRGFTNHEMLDNVGLIHMNGRVYDPAIGRFISADPFIDGWTHPQGWNRYSYVLNNPLSYIDPSGFCRSRSADCPYPDGFDPLYPNEPRGRQNDGKGGARAGGPRGGGRPDGPPHPTRPLPLPAPSPSAPNSPAVGAAALCTSVIGCDTSNVSTVGGATIGPTSGRADFFIFNPVGRAIARPLDLLAPYAAWVYGGEYVNPLAGEILSPRRRQDADVLSIATGPAGIVRSTASRAVVGGFRMTESVASHVTDVVGKGPFKGELARPFLNSPLTIQEIMAAGKGVPDPGGVAGALRWNVPGSFRGAEGTWELVIKDDLILHFNFVGN